MTGNILTYLSNSLKCGKTESIPLAASNFLLSLPSETFVFGYQSIDILIDEALRRFAVRVEKVNDSETSYLGRLYTRTGGFTMKIRQDIPPLTFRFVKAHELAHTLAYDKTSARPRRLFPNSFEEENLCDRIARNALLPEFVLRNYLINIGLLTDNFDVKGLISLSREYGVVPWQTVRRIIEGGLQDIDKLVAILWKRESIDTLKIVDRLFPQGLYVPTRDRAFDSGDLNQTPWKALAKSDAIEEKALINIGALNGSLENTCFPYNYAGIEWIVQVIVLDDAHKDKLSKWRTAHAHSSYAS